MEDIRNRCGEDNAGTFGTNNLVQGGVKDESLGLSGEEDSSRMQKCKTEELGDIKLSLSALSSKCSWIITST